MSNRLIFSAFLLGASAIAMVVRDYRAPLEAPPFPALLQQDGETAEMRPSVADNSFASDSESPRSPVAKATAVAASNAANVGEPKALQLPVAKPALPEVATTRLPTAAQPQRKRVDPAPQMIAALPAKNSAQFRRSSPGESQEPAELRPPQPVVRPEIEATTPEGPVVADPDRFRRLISFLNSREQTQASVASVQTRSDQAEANNATNVAPNTNAPNTNAPNTNAPNTNVAQPQGARYAPPPPSPYLAAQGVQGGGGANSAIVFAGGAVELQAPWDWRTYEVSAGRELRLAVSPVEIRSRDQAIEGLWVACHVRAQASDNQADMRNLMMDRMDAVAKGAAARPAISHEIAGKIGYRSEYTLGDSVGFHILIPTPWGVCEVHARTADLKTVNQLNAIANSIVLRDAPPHVQAKDLRVQASAQILGAWKAYRSRLRLSGEGRIEIEPETNDVRPLGEESETPAKVLRGEFEARDDLLFVRWDDGSFLNFRWRLDGDSLLLTDHEGRVSELRMLLE